jgi:hypothetical protein
MSLFSATVVVNTGIRQGRGEYTHQEKLQQEWQVLYQTLQSETAVGFAQDAFPQKERTDTHIATAMPQGMQRGEPQESAPERQRRPG